MDMGEAAIEKPKVRLKFIDLARAIAILLMLEGHFVGLTLADQALYKDHPVYMVWNFIRGFTAPLFFTVAGMIFTYLLMGAKEVHFWKRVRVRKGLMRAGELLVWGYVLQLWIKSWRDYLRGNFSDWFYAFHVLQCIGMGLILLILVAWICSFFKKLPLYVGYLITLVVALMFYSWMKGLPEGAYFPEGAPQLVQNMFRGKYSVFPIVPWLAFPLLGGALGAFLRNERVSGTGAMAKYWLFLVALGLRLLWGVIPEIPGLSAEVIEGFSWFAGRASQVVFFLGLLRWIEIRWGIGLSWMRRVGQETFAIYIFHVMVLYGGTFGLGLKNWYKEALSPWEAAGGALLFVSFFAGYAVLLNMWKARRRAAKLVAAG
ncbi:heparan-alpha-glucosaminide N-acetyltransferase domain-containing protein [Luteolibacter sp. AS25]|uniref:heparan-alpha-glucosaminide N-acetyltransferase domain-containing protein n=1 Tax=Luteolibacter sp. AS25 TaxID=3135776 RepID=UPI00398B8D96